MSKQDPADQVKFLVACIGHTTNGRPDFQQVAADLGIVSKAAAQKRYERMLKAHGISASAKANATNNGTEKPGPKTPTKRKARTALPGSSSKKSKASPPKAEEDAKAVKKEPVKQEDDSSTTSSLTDIGSETNSVKSEC